MRQSATHCWRSTLKTTSAGGHTLARGLLCAVKKGCVPIMHFPPPPRCDKWHARRPAHWKSRVQFDTLWALCELKTAPDVGWSRLHRGGIDKLLLSLSLSTTICLNHSPQPLSPLKSKPERPLALDGTDKSCPPWPASAQAQSPVAFPVAFPRRTGKGQK